MSKTTIAKRSIQFSSAKSGCKLLFSMKSKAVTPYSLQWHKHPFWQVDFAWNESFFVEYKSTKTKVSPGEIIILPPSVRHRFIYPAGAGFLTFKFEAKYEEEKNRPYLLNDSNVLTGIRKALFAIYPQLENLQKKPVMITEELLYATLLLAYENDEENADDTQSSFVNHVRSIINSATNKRLTVSEIAESMGYSVNYTSSRYQKETGESLKSAIDSERLLASEKLLRFSDLTISQIANTLGFADVYSFSRFFKNKNKLSPKKWRSHIIVHEK